MEKSCCAFASSLLVGVLVILCGCTGNPFFEDDEMTVNDVIRGTVALVDGLNPDGVFVYFQACDISTRTDESGFFQLTTPPPGSQPGSGLTGMYNLYFFVANYRLDSARVVLRDGYVEYGQGDLDEDGKLRQTRVLSKLLNMTTILDPDSVAEDYEGSIEGTVRLEAIDDSVRVTIPKMMGEILTVAFLHRADSDTTIDMMIEHPVYYSDTAGEYTIGSSPREWPLWIEWPPVMDRVIHTFPPGEYEIIPYLLVHQSNLPSGLMESLGEEVEDFSLEYLDYPIKRRFGIFVLGESGTEFSSNGKNLVLK